MTQAFFRHQIVLHRPTLQFGDVQTDPLGGLPRRTIPVVINTFGGTPKQHVEEFPANECILLGWTWAQAWEELRRLRDEEELPLSDRRIAAPKPIEVQS